MTGTEPSNIRITRARAAKSALNNAIPPVKQLPPAPIVQTKPNGKRAATESNISGSSVAAEPVKRRAVLADVSNICREAAAVDCLKRPKTVKVTEEFKPVVSQNATGKGRGRGFPRGNKKVTQEAEIKNETSPVIRNVVNVSTSKAIGVDKENNNVNPLQEVHNPKVPNPTTEQISVHAHCKLTEEKPNDNKIVPSNTEAEVASLKQQPTLQSLDIARQPKPSLKQGNPVPLAKLHEDVGRSSCLDFIDIDSEYKDPQMCVAYVTDIYANMRVIELKRRPLPNFMETIQRDINANMRGVLIDWLVEVSEEYKLVPDTLYLTVSFIDRFLSANVVNRQRLQLLGVSCMLVASKYEEICAPPVEEFCYITDNTYKKEEVLDMEVNVLNRLQYDLTTPTTKTFLRRFIRAAQASCKVSSLHLEFMGNYLAELTLVEYDFLKYLPSQIAAAAVFVARMTLDPKVHPWNSTLQHYTGYKVSDMRDCICAIHDLQLNRKGCTLAAIRDKYNQPKFKSVANFSPLPVISPQFFGAV
nr:cyclin A 2;2 [Larix kaempferi]